MFKSLSLLGVKEVDIANWDEPGAVDAVYQAPPPTEAYLVLYEPVGVP